MPDVGRRLFATAAGLLLSLLTVNAVAADSVQHTVRAGDTLSGIANKYGITVEIIAEINGIADPNLIIVGDVLDISDSSQQSRPSRGDSYVIQPGDTLGHIAVMFGTTVDEIKVSNGLNSDLIIAGDSLMVSAVRLDQPEAAPASAPSYEVPTTPIQVPAQRPHSPEIEAMIDEIAPAAGVDPGIVKSIAWVESGFDQSAESPAGAVGVMQLMPGTVEWLESDVFGQELNEHVSAYDNIKAGAYLLAYLQYHTGSPELAVAAYYQGLGATQQGVMYNETRRYVEGVLAIRVRYWP